MKKLTTSITSNSVKLIDLYNKINSESLIPSPDFQRNLVWKKQHKYALIKTILLNYPFPEVYIASTEVDVDTLQAKEIVVDGQQRLTTIVDYIKGIGDFKKQTSLTSFDDLNTEEKKEFLNYSVTVKDLKDIGIDNIKEIFKRINSTNYALNSNEVLNAEYGDGEFSMFCKQIVDFKFEPTIDVTDIILSIEVRTQLFDFFNDKKIFSDNDIKRMYDINYIMLLSATILEGKYFGRSSKINRYLQKYNTNFAVHETVLTALVNSISIINNLNFSNKSYWFNKANLFTLIIEFSLLEENCIDLGLLESKLLDIAKKVDVYFTDEDISTISDDERKYFEFARQGSHELAAREQRGYLIKSLISLSNVQEKSLDKSVLSNNIEKLKNENIPYALIVPTETGLKKSIMDAVTEVRNYLLKNEIHDYSKQGLGPDSKNKIPCSIISSDGSFDSEMTLYRSNGRGDYRIWISGLTDYANANDELALVVVNKKVMVYNISVKEHDFDISKS